MKNKTVKNCLEYRAKVRFFKNVLDKINSSKNLQKLPHQFPAVREGSFCKFLDELILSSTFLRKTDFKHIYSRICEIRQQLLVFSIFNVYRFFCLTLYTLFSKSVDEGEGVGVEMPKILSTWFMDGPYVARLEL